MNKEIHGTIFKDGDLVYHRQREWYGKVISVGEIYVEVECLCGHDPHEDAWEIDKLTFPRIRRL